MVKKTEDESTPKAPVKKASTTKKAAVKSGEPKKTTKPAPKKAAAKSTPTKAVKKAPVEKKATVEKKETKSLAQKADDSKKTEIKSTEPEKTSLGAETESGYIVPKKGASKFQIAAIGALSVIAVAIIAYLVFSIIQGQGGAFGIKVSSDGNCLAVPDQNCITIPADLKIGKDDSGVLRKGDGDPIKEGSVLEMQAVIYDITSLSDISVATDTWKQGTPETLTYSKTNLYESIYQALEGQSVGTVFVWVNETEQPAQETAEGASPAPTITTKHLGIGTVTAILPSRAEGKAQKQDANQPTVTLNEETGEPNIVFPKGYKASKELFSEVTVLGTGEEVKATDSLTVQYSGWFLDGKVFDSSWKNKSTAQINLNGGVIDGWTQGLAGKKVGSQVLLVIPPELGYGTEAYQEIPANSTLVFVVDILKRQPLVETQTDDVEPAEDAETEPEAATE